MEWMMVILIIISGILNILLMVMNSNLENEIKSRTHDIFICEYRIRILNDTLAEELKRKSSHVNISKDIKDAVYYAMIKAHPDNGGRQEDFIKYRKLYEGIK